MNATVLEHLLLCFRPLWNRHRRLAGFELIVEATQQNRGFDARHLLASLDEFWPANAPHLLLTVHHRALLLDLLVHAHRDSPWITVSHEALSDAVLAPRVLAAQQRGVPLVWPLRRQPDPSPQAGSHPTAWHIGSAAELGGQAGSVLFLEPLLLADVHAAFDASGAWAVVGWPDADVLSRLAPQAARPDASALDATLRQIRVDASLERIEQSLSNDAVLSYRYLQEANARAGREQGTIDTVARGLQLCGLGHAERWLTALAADADPTPDLLPLRWAMVLQARLLEHLLEPGDEEDLRREVYLCGLFARLGSLLNEDLGDVLARIPVSQRILQSLLSADGPYRPALELATALQGRDPARVLSICVSYGYGVQDVNRALLRTLAGWRH